MRRIALLIALIGATILFANCTKKSDLALRYDMEKKLTAADRLSEELRAKSPTLSDDDLKILVKNYGEIVGLCKPPKNSEAVINAKDDLKRAWAISALAQTRIGTLYFERKKYDEAFAFFKSVADNPATTDIQRNAMLSYMAIAQERVRNYVTAADCYQQLAAGYGKIISPQNPNMDALDAPLKQAQMSLKTGDKSAFDSFMEDARIYYKNIVAKYPKTPIYSVALGKIAASYIMQDRFTEAIEILRTAVNDSTGLISPDVMLMMADIYMNNLKDYKGAENTYREFIKNYPKVKMITSGILGLGLSLYEQERYAEAREAVKDIDKKQQPGANPVIVIEGKYLAALCLAKDNRWDQALGQFNFIQATFPGSDKAFESGLYIANYYKDKGETKLADNAFSNIEKYIIKYTNPETTNPMLAARATGYLARCYTEEENFPKAIETLATLHSKYPKTTDGQLAPLRLADLYENVLQDKAKAIEWLTLFIAENPDAENIAELEAHIKALSQ